MTRIGPIQWWEKKVFFKLITQRLGDEKVKADMIVKLERIFAVKCEFLLTCSGSPSWCPLPSIIVIPILFTVKD